MKSSIIAQEHIKIPTLDPTVKDKEPCYINWILGHQDLHCRFKGAMALVCIYIFSTPSALQRPRETDTHVKDHVPRHPHGSESLDRTDLRESSRLTARDGHCLEQIRLTRFVLKANTSFPLIAKFFKPLASVVYLYLHLFPSPL